MNFQGAPIETEEHIHAAVQWAVDNGAAGTREEIEVWLRATLAREIGPVPDTNLMRTAMRLADAIAHRDGVPIKYADDPFAQWVRAQRPNALYNGRPVMYIPARVEEGEEL